MGFVCDWLFFFIVSGVFECRESFGYKRLFFLDYLPYFALHHLSSVMVAFFLWFSHLPWLFCLNLFFASAASSWCFFLTGSLSFRCFVWFSCVWLPSADFLSVIASSFWLFTSEDGSLFCCTFKVS
uniref:Uncharacterized protein n=1 Tax=Populus davidiana TaxID=266767 RepID=A0A6M2F4G6_9ROSI